MRSGLSHRPIHSSGSHFGKGSRLAVSDGIAGRFFLEDHMNESTQWFRCAYCQKMRPARHVITLAGVLKKYFCTLACAHNWDEAHRRRYEANSKASGS